MPVTSWITPPPPSASVIESLSRTLGVSPVTALLLARRGYTDPGVATAFLHPSSAHSYDPFLMKGMSALASRVHGAITAGEPILIFGDYDADGIPGTALLYLYLKRVGAKVSYLIPNREDGYGLTLEAAAKVLARAPKLVITIDCGSSDHEAITFLAEHGIDVAVTDHHLTLKGVPPTRYFVNPARADGETYPFKGLCGCGVAYKLVQALSRRSSEPGLWELVAISTIGDQVALTGENRFYVKAAIDNLHRAGNGNIGLRAIAATASVALSTINPTHIGWRICPRINAMGRMGLDPNLVVELLATSDHGRANQIAAMLQKANAGRQVLTDVLFEQAKQSMLGQPANALICAYLPEATVGVAGLVASKLVEEYQRPTLVVNAEGRGSGRCPDGQSIMPYLAQLRAMGIFGPRRVGNHTVTADYGGHPAACGFHNVEPARLRAAASSIIVPTSEVGVMRVDGTASLPSLTPRLAREVELLAPFGIGNPEPRLMVPAVSASNLRASRTGQTLLFDISDGKTTHHAFWYGHGKMVAQGLPATLDVLVSPIPNDAGGVDLQVLGARKSSARA